VVVDRRPLTGEHPGGVVDGLLRPRAADELALRRRRPDRGGGHAAEADARAGDLVVHDVEGERDGDAGDVVEAPLGDLVEGRQAGLRQRQHDLGDQLARSADAAPVPGEVVGERHLAPALGGRQHQPGLQREQRRRGVTDR
jgi:hypothetical protein